MADDYGSLVTEIQNEMSRGTALESLVRASIQEAILHYESRMFWFNQERATASTVAGQDYYDLPADFRKMHWLFIAGDRELVQTNIREIEKSQVSNFTAGPEYFAVWRREYRLYPVPDAVYTLRLFYAKKLSALSDDQDTNAWMVEGKALVKYRAKYLLYMNKVRDDKMATAMTVLEGEALDELDRQTAQIVQTPTLRMPAGLARGRQFDVRTG